MVGKPMLPADCGTGYCCGRLCVGGASAVIGFRGGGLGMT